MAKRLRVALFVESSSAYGRGVLRGIRRYVADHQSWSILWKQLDIITPLPRDLANWEIDGLISRSTDPEMAEQLQSARFPVVDLTDRHKDFGLNHIWTDNQAVGQIAAEHLIERRFRHFAFVGYEKERWCIDRCNSFQEELAQHGFTCHTYLKGDLNLSHEPLPDQRDHLAEWLKSLPQPVGIMACHDVRGHQILDVLSELEISVPENAAVIGCDDDELRCQFTSPPMSSVRPNSDLIGYRSAFLLDELMAKRQQSPLPTEYIAPLGITIRHSSDILAIEDQDIAMAVKLIREHALEGITVKDILTQVPVSRSYLERGMRRFLKRSPQAEIRNIQLKRVRQLLSETEFPLSEIAHQCGFQHPEYMSVVFKRELGETPGQYRKRTRMGSAAPAIR